VPQVFTRRSEGRGPGQGHGLASTWAIAAKFDARFTRLALLGVPVSGNPVSSWVQFWPSIQRAKNQPRASLRPIDTSAEASPAGQPGVELGAVDGAVDGEHRSGVGIQRSGPKGSVEWGS